MAKKGGREGNETATEVEMETVKEKERKMEMEIEEKNVKAFGSKPVIMAEIPGVW